MIFELTSTLSLFGLPLTLHLKNLMKSLYALYAVPYYSSYSPALLDPNLSDAYLLGNGFFSLLEQKHIGNSPRPTLT